MQKGITLVEILITIGIIGVVSTLTIPSLYAAYKKHETISKLKEAYSIFQQAVKLSIVDNDDISGWNLSTADIINSSDCRRIAETYFLPYMSGTYRTNKSYEMKTLGTDNLKFLYWDKNSLFQMKNGMIFSVGAYYGNMRVTVDLNGISMPNRLGIDGFVFELNKTKNNIQFYGENESDSRLLYPVSGLGGECKRGTNMQYYTGAYCGALIKRNNWSITKIYPWANGN